MEFEGGLAFDLVSASVLGSAPVGEPASNGGPQAEFHVTDRISLLKTLKNALNVDIPPTVWACLWLSDIDNLKVLVKQEPNVLFAYFNLVESKARIAQKCEAYRLPCVLIDLLIFDREPTRAQAFWLLNSSATAYSTSAAFPSSTISSTGATFPNSTTFLSATTISSTATLYSTG
jgi:hypothetical protein